MRSPSGTFLLRFSDSELGGITIAWVAEDPKGSDCTCGNVMNVITAGSTKYIHLCA